MRQLNLGAFQRDQSWSAREQAKKFHGDEIHVEFGRRKEKGGGESRVAKSTKKLASKKEHIRRQAASCAAC